MVELVFISMSLRALYIYCLNFHALRKLNLVLKFYINLLRLIYRCGFAQNSCVKSSIVALKVGGNLCVPFHVHFTFFFSKMENQTSGLHALSLTRIDDSCEINSNETFIFDSFTALLCKQHSNELQLESIKTKDKE